jgi:hypothetical protein
MLPGNIAQASRNLAPHLLMPYEVRREIDRFILLAAMFERDDLGSVDSESVT